ncbi:hypothetical protein Q7C36_012013 [Tachysurus vachellii]|uniref:Interferon-induced very large GTPase 1 domain-containing protein n=1 Tax=Tachysurus vachellii TaxID=175792 RepID=A0AA88SSJ9_TACVA|nr:hypothetical protein Q7C36_012013 [Tachysurus vachellii]
MLKARKGEQLFQIPEFLQWMSSLWKAVKFENFIFSFRNTLVAHAYDNLCKEFSDWEWSFRRPILFLISKAEVQLSNTETSSIHGVVDALKKKTEKELMIQLQEMTKKLKEYYKRKDRNVHLVEKYKTDFIKSINCLETEMKNEVNKRLDLAIEMKKNTAKLEEIHSKQAAMVESQVLQLLQKYKARNDEVSDEDLKADFERMWRREIANFTGLKERDVPADVLKQLRASLGNRQVNEDFQNVTNLTQCGKEGFKVRERDQCQKKAQNFTQLCLKPAVTEYIDQSIGPDIVDAVLENESTAYSSRSLFQYTIQKELLEKSNFSEIKGVHFAKHHVRQEERNISNTMQLCTDHKALEDTDIVRLIAFVKRSVHLVFMAMEHF